MVPLSEVLRSTRGHCRLEGGAHRGVLVLTGQVQHLQAGWQGVQRLAQDLVEVLGPQGSARHQQRGQVGVESQRLSALDAGLAGPLVRGTLRDQGGDGRAQRQSCDLGAALGGLETGRGEGQGDGLGPGGAQPVGQAWAGVLLMDDDRNPGLPGGQVSGGRHVAAEADDDVGLDLLNGLSSRADRLAQPVRQTQQVTTGAPRQRDSGDQGQLQAGLGHEPLLQSLGGPQDEDLRAGVTAQGRVPQGRSRGQQRVDVAGGAPAGQQHPQRPGPLRAAGTLLLGRACALTCLGHGSS